MKEIRDLIQSKFNEIKDLESGPAIPDDIVENETTYFGYELQEDYLNSDLDSNYTMQINITGRLIRKNNSAENTLEIIDKVLSKLKEKLKELNFKYSYQDITMDNGIRKILVIGKVNYNEINKKFIV